MGLHQVRAVLTKFGQCVFIGVLYILELYIDVAFDMCCNQVVCVIILICDKLLCAISTYDIVLS